MASPKGYDAARSAAAVSRVPGLACAVFTGSDRAKFLHGLLTADVLGLKPGRGARSCFLTPKGILVAELCLFDRGDDLLSVHPAACHEPLTSGLSKYLLLSETKLESPPARLLFAAGPRAAETAAKAFGAGAPSPLAHACVDWRGGRVALLGVPFFGGGVAVVVEPAAEEAAWNAFLEAGAEELSEAALETLRVEAGRLRYGVDNDAGTLPGEAGLEEAVDFDKGCYLGQETTARVKYRGHLNRRLCGVRLVAGTRPGATLQKDGKPVGVVTSVADSPRAGGALGLALLRTEAAEPGSTFDSGDEVVALPL